MAFLIPTLGIPDTYLALTGTTSNQFIMSHDNHGHIIYNTCCLMAILSLGYHQHVSSEGIPLSSKCHACVEVQFAVRSESRTEVPLSFVEMGQAYRRIGIKCSLGLDIGMECVQLLHPVHNEEQYLQQGSGCA